MQLIVGGGPQPKPQVRGGFGGPPGGGGGGRPGGGGVRIGG
jgi:translation initiation factor IF-2